MTTLRRMHETGVIRRIAVAPNHCALGLTANGMSVWDVEDARIADLGAQVGADVEFPGELSHAEALDVLDDLGGFGVPAPILSGGEPMGRFDFFDLAEAARRKVRFPALSTNGTKLHGAAPLVARTLATAGVAA